MLLIGDSLAAGLGHPMAKLAARCGTPFYEHGVVGAHVTEWRTDGWLLPQLAAARPTLASAIQIGNPVSIEKAIDALRRYDGIVEQASESEIAEACAHADRTGLFNCPHTGVALAATRKLVGAGTIRKGDRVVVISTAHGLKFVDFKVKYHSMTLEGLVPEVPNPPIELPARYEAVRDAMLREIDARFPR